MLSIRSLSKKFKAGNFGVQDFSLEVESGVLGLLGPNGAGKTTLMQMVATLLKPTSGEIRFRGIDVAEEPDALRARLGYLPQNFGVYDNLTAREFLTYIASLKGVRSKSRVQEMLKAVNLHTLAERPLAGFSGGMKQRLGIAQALINEPDLVIVDEPTAGLDPEERVRFRNLLSEVAEGRLVILSTHIASDIESSATRIAILREGSLIVCGSPEELLQAAVGHVWETVVSSSELEHLQSHARVSRAVRRSDGVHVRFVGSEAPVSGARQPSPTLEDAYLHFMSSPEPQGQPGK